MVKGDLDDAIKALVAAAQSFAENAEKASSSGAARDNAEAGERFANGASALIEARGKLPT
jgi:hypothetical protein